MFKTIRDVPHCDRCKKNIFETNQMFDVKGFGHVCEECVLDAVKLTRPPKSSPPDITITIADDIKSSGVVASVIERAYGLIRRGK